QARLHEIGRGTQGRAGALGSRLRAGGGPEVGEGHRDGVGRRVDRGRDRAKVRVGLQVEGQAVPAAQQHVVGAVGVGGSRLLPRNREQRVVRSALRRGG